MRSRTKNKKTKIVDLQRAVAANPDSAEAHMKLGTAWLHSGAARKAEKSLRRAVKIDPLYDEAWVNLGGLLLARWDFAGCVEVNRTVAERTPDLLMAHFNQGLGHLYLREVEEMISCFRLVLEIDPDHGAGHYYHAVGLLDTGNVEAARTALDRAAKLGHSPEPEFLKALERRNSRENACPRNSTTAGAVDLTGTIEGGR